MIEREELLFKLNGERNGASISPANFDISELTRYMKEVEEFLRPEANTLADKAHDPITLQYEEGSVQLRVGLSSRRGRAITQLMAEVKQPQRVLRRDHSVAVGYDLSVLAPRQRRVLRLWHSRAQATGDKYQVLSPEMPDTALLLIDKYTTLLEAPEDTWVPTQQYLHGKIQELGGIKKAELVIQAEGRSYTVQASQEILAQQERNRLYHESIVRVAAERNIQTGELRNLVLLGFVDYAPTLDRRQHERASHIVTQAFADVPNLSVWINQLRGE